MLEQAEAVVVGVNDVVGRPVLTEHVETGIRPIPATLDRVGPDGHELLDVLKEVRQAINGFPASTSSGAAVTGPS